MSMISVDHHWVAFPIKSAACAVLIVNLWFLISAPNTDAQPAQVLEVSARTFSSGRNCQFLHGRLIWHT